LVYFRTVLGYFHRHVTHCLHIKSQCVVIDGEKMPKPQKLKNKNGTVSYRAQVYKKIGDKVYRESKSFSTLQLAKDWSAKREAELERIAIYGEQSKEKIKDVIERYQKQYGHNYGRSKNYDLNRITKYDIANLDVSELTPKAIIRHCIERNQEAKPQTVFNDVIWLKTVIKTMSSSEGFDFDMNVFEKAMQVLKKEKLVGRSRQRERRPTKQELCKLSRVFARSRSKIPMLHLMWFAIYSARRLSEITRLRWDDNNNEKQTGMVRDAKDPRNKKGNNRRFKYTPSAWKIVCKQERKGEYIFPYNDKTIGTLFQRACNMLEIEDLHFHDLRHEAASRLFESGLGIEKVQLYTLHQNWATLKRYTHLRPEDL
jgi:integrase